jgi:formylglycine-generating enzyme required for sulfatase activity
MAWLHKAKDLYKRFGAPAKFAAKLVLGTVVPGSPAVIELVEKALDCAAETVKDNLDASPADLGRLEEALDVLLGGMEAQMAKLARLEQTPDIAREILDLALATDDACRKSARMLEQCVSRFDRVARQQDRLVAGMEEARPLIQRMAGVSDYIDELKAAGCTPQRFGRLFDLFEKALSAFAAQRFGEAERLLSQADAEQPNCGAVAVALAATQTAGHQFIRAEATLARAVRLRPADAELADLHHRVTVLSRRGETPPALGAGLPTPPPLQPGDILDGWTLEQLLGRGGWGQVWKATKADEVAALKTMHPELARDPSFVERFKREIKTLIKLDRHPSLVEIDTFGHVGDFWYIVMQFIAGVSLEHHLARHGALTWEQARPLFEGIADGLRLAHARGIVHRDIKPANILLREGGGGVLVDFGLAGMVDAASKTGRAGYTPLFAAPEQLRSGQADAKSDVFSLAATLNYALAYNDPLHREPHCFDPALVPQAIRTVLTRSLVNNPAERPADATAFLVSFRYNPTAEKQLVALYEAIVDRTQGKPTDADKTALRELCNKYGIATERANAVLRDIHARWREAHPPKIELRPVEIFENSLGMKFAWCPPGTFVMGSRRTEADSQLYETQHKVTLTKGFYIGVHPVTQAQWRAVMGSNPSHFKGDHLPVEQVSWEQCHEFCNRLGQKDGKRYRLPTEAEWEYACRAGTTTSFYFGETISTDQVNYDGNYPYGKGKKGRYRQMTSAVGSFPPNAWGLYDMHGNVWEWCQDWYGPYPAGGFHWGGVPGNGNFQVDPAQAEEFLSQIFAGMGGAFGGRGAAKHIKSSTNAANVAMGDLVDPQGDGKGQMRVLRGGCWHDNAWGCRSSVRGRSAPGDRSSDVGCRVVLCLD